MRIVSLLPSATEILCALGAEASLVGRSHECDFPPSVAKLPVLTAPRFPVAGTSAEIDRGVRDLVKQALSLYQIDTAQLAALKPDLIVTQSQCEVCAVSLREVEAAAAEMVGGKTQVLSLQPNTLVDVWADVERVAKAIGDGERGVELVVELDRRVAEISARAARITGVPTVACIEWIDPLMAAGHWTVELVERAGAASCFGVVGEKAPPLAWEALVAADPDVIVVMPCGFDVARARTEVAALAKRPEWSRLRAVTGKRVFLVDGNAYFNRPGPRLVESLEILGELFHPEVFDFHHRGAGWMPL